MSPSGGRPSGLRHLLSSRASWRSAVARRAMPIMAALLMLAAMGIPATRSPAAAQVSQATVKSTCLAENGRIDITVYNFDDTPNDYVVAVSGLAPRQRTVAGGESQRVSITGRADGVYQVTADRIDGERLVAQEVEVTCDPASRDAQVTVRCLDENGLISVAVTNRTSQTREYGIQLTGLDQRLRTLTAGSSVTVGFSGRPDQRYTVDITNDEGRVFRNAYQVSCDRPVLDGVTVTVDCISGNGRIRTTVANDTQTTNTYFVTVTGLDPRSVDIAPDRTATVTVTGRADNNYTVEVAEGSVDAVFSTSIATVACDSPAPRPGPPTPVPVPLDPPPRPAVVDRIAALGDFGGGYHSFELQVSELIDELDPDLITTLGDNVYSAEVEDPWDVLDRKVGQYYHEWIYPYLGSYGEGSPTGENRFFPSLGNHDWGDPGTQLLFCDGPDDCTGSWVDFFTLPNNERYYVVETEHVDLFVIDDYYLEPDGHRVDSVQAEWLRNELAASDAEWKLIINHFPPYTNGTGGSPSIRWPFKEWGADAMLSGHVHSYQRMQREGMTFIVNGLGGISLNPLLRPTQWTRFQYNKQYGATMIEASETQLTMELVTIDRQVLDWTVEYRVSAGETAESIAGDFDTTTDLLAELNPDVDLAALAPGTVITVAPL